MAILPQALRISLRHQGGFELGSAGWAIRRKPQSKLKSADDEIARLALKLTYHVAELSAAG